MTRRRLVSLLATPLVLWGTAVHGAQGGGAGQAAQRAERRAEVLALERAWLDAYQTRDAAVMDAIVGEEFIITYPDGRARTKADVMAQISGDGPAPRFSTEEVQDRQFGDTVILTGTLVTETDGGRRRSRYTDTWVRRAGRWQVVASHLSAAPSP